MMPWLRLSLVAAVLLMGLGAAAGASARQVPVPSSGAYLGLLTQIDGLSPGQAMARRESQFSRTFDIGSHYYDWANGFPSSRWEPDDIAHGRIPMITWWGTKYAAISNGSQDRVIRAAARNVKAFRKPVFLRWAAEMNGNWFAWSGPHNNNNPAGFVAAWRHIHDIFTAQGVKNVSWVWSPNFRSAPGGLDTRSWNNWRNYYPGGKYVDWVGIDGYNWGALPAGDGWKSFGTLMKPVYDDYASRKPIMIAETGSTESGGDKAQWITDMGKWVKAHRAIKAVVYFDRTTGWGWDWSLDTSKASANAFAKLAADPYFKPRRSSPRPRATRDFVRDPGGSTTAASR